MFLHGGLSISPGTWSLWIFGDNIEDRMGPARFLVFYILCGLAAGVGPLGGRSPLGHSEVGAAAAISGVMGAYLVMYPLLTGRMLFPIFFLPYFPDPRGGLPRVLVRCFQIASGAATLASESDAAGVAFWAHAGGFVAGIVLHRLFLWPKGEPSLPAGRGQIDRAWMPLR